MSRKAAAGGVGACLLALVAPAPATAQAQARSMDPVTVTATRVERSGFELPASVDSFGLDPLAAQRPGVNLSESLGRVPGIVVRDRQNFAQDLQVSSRGFGARASFGVRGVRLLQDGVPLTMPDGQGQTGLFDLDAASRIEVLRGPFAALYGNSSGGVVSLFTEDPPAAPTLRLNGGAGSFGAWKMGLGYGAPLGAVAAGGAVFNASRFATDGYRDHSRARRDLFGAKLAWGDERDDGRFMLSATALDQPDTQDPLGLTREQLDQDPTQAGAGAIAFDTRKSVDHRQAGIEWSRRLGDSDRLVLRGYGGDRRVVQFLAFSGAAAGSSGGVVDLDRGFGGLGLQWTREARLAGGPLSFSLGVDYDRMSERRRGFVNQSGVAGELRRNERDTVWNFDQYAIAEWWFADRWRLAGGVRHSSVSFRVDDDYVTAVNPDDSGRRDYSATRPVLGLLYAASDSVNLYASAGRGFETPTFAELAYRPDGQPGVNFALEASTSTNLELGLKARPSAASRLNLALFRASTRNDIVPDANVAGRTTFRNAARTARRGVELGMETALGRGFEAWLAWTWIDAEFRDYVSLAGEDLSGRALPGVPKHLLQAELAWRHAPSGFATALEAQWAAKVWVDDANSASAASYAVANWRFGYDWRVAGWRILPYARIDNLFDARYVGSVIVNAASGRYYEPAPGRAWFAGVKASRRF
ncbi:TonB-dependent receptor [Burkholderiaceae bacterium FT117]|uniref:TonB-dependent receptor family protein n=1 Tax=Zeimonas sediminis TaxID=2944268 RepID=UPI002342CB2C|nr:TonB-dependent receptor [Zeimonas sediminis]MCM5571128.1 TonB-dependent receptor [Zeimonas sediminis]